MGGGACDTEACVGGSQVVMLCVGVWHWCCGSPDYCIGLGLGLRASKFNCFLFFSSLFLLAEPTLFPELRVTLA